MNRKFFKFGLLLLAVLILAGCSTPAAQTPTPDPKLVYTQVAQTVAAQITNAAKLTPKATFTPLPSDTPMPTQTPKATNATIVALTGTAKPGTAVATSATSIAISTATLAPTLPGALPPVPDKMEYVSQSIPDNTKFNPNQEFTITWTIKNIGTTTWDEKYRIRFFGGERGGAADDAVDGPVAPQKSYNVTMKMTAPEKPGSYSTLWVITNPDGRNFGSFYLAYEVK